MGNSSGRIENISSELERIKGDIQTLRDASQSAEKENERLRLENKELSDKNALLFQEYENLCKVHEELTRDRETLFSAHSDLLKTARDAQSATEVRQITSKISDKAIDEYVQKIFSDPTVHHGRLSIITDAVEAAVYRKALKAVLHAFALAAETSHVQLIGHRLVYGIQPVEEDIVTTGGTATTVSKLESFEGLKLESSGDEKLFESRSDA